MVQPSPPQPPQVLAAAKRDAASLELERLQQSGQRFLPNPAGIKADAAGFHPSEGGWSMDDENKFATEKMGMENRDID